MQRLHNLDKWTVLPDGKSANFGGVHSRRVRLDVNAPQKTRLFYSNGDGQVMFLALVEGRDVIEFLAQGEFAVTAEGGDVWLHTIDGEDISFEVLDPVIFTRIVERRGRNHEIELMNYMMNQNMERRYAAMREDLDREWTRREQAAAAAAAQSVAAGDGKPSAGEPKPASSAGDDKQPEPANAGDGSKAEPAKAK